MRSQAVSTEEVDWPRWLARKTSTERFRAASSTSRPEMMRPLEEGTGVKPFCKGEIKRRGREEREGVRGERGMWEKCAVGGIFWGRYGLGGTRSFGAMPRCHKARML